MLTLKIPDLNYAVYEQIRDAIVEIQPFGLTGAPIYSKKLRVGIFYFQDLRYVPEKLKEMSMGIPGNAALVVQLNKKLEKIEYF